MAQRLCASEDDTAREVSVRRGKKASLLLLRKCETNRGTSWSLDKVAAPRTSLAGPLYNFGTLVSSATRGFGGGQSARRRWYLPRA